MEGKHLQGDFGSMCLTFPGKRSRCRDGSRHSGWRLSELGLTLCRSDGDAVSLALCSLAWASFGTMAGDGIDATADHSRECSRHLHSFQRQHWLPLMTTSAPAISTLRQSLARHSHSNDSCSTTYPTRTDHQTDQCCCRRRSYCYRCCHCYRAMIDAPLPPLQMFSY